jgi:hypothetical protein
LALGAFFSEKYRPNDLGAFFFKSPKFLPLNSQIFNNTFFGKIFLFSKAPFWAIFQQNWPHFSVKRLVTLSSNLEATKQK